MLMMGAGLLLAQLSIRQEEKIIKDVGSPRWTWWGR